MRIFLFMPYIYAVLNLYIFWRMRSGFGPGRWQWAALLFLALMVFLFLQRRAVVGSAWETTVHAASLLWFGVVLITVTGLLFLDAARLLAWFMDLGAGTHMAHLLRPSRSVPVVLALCGLLSVYAYFEAVTIRTTRITIPTHKLPPETPRLRIAAMSDVHINALTGMWRLERMVAAAKSVHPDILLMLGDFVDTNMRGKEKEAALFKSVSPRLGAYAVLGNHEAYSGIANAEQFIRDAGFTVLRSTVARVGGIILVGVDDPVFMGGRSPSGIAKEEAVCLELLTALKNEGNTGFTLLLRHRPGKHGNIAGLFDLQLSGHTHGGQIWPASLIVKYANKGFLKGMTVVSGEHGQSRLYISPGTGVWGPPMRLFTPPEVTVIDLVRSPEA